MATSRSILARATRCLATSSPRVAASAQRTALPAFQTTSKTYLNRTSCLSIRAHSSEAAPSPVEPPDYLDERELNIFNMLKESLQPTKLEVQDVSGGCGSMYALDIISAQFKGLPVIKQHRLVNKILEDEIKKWHGVQLKTRAP